jgi:hypothetical protein
MCGGGIVAGDRRNHLDSFFVSPAALQSNNKGVAHANTNRRPDSNSDTNPSAESDSYSHFHASAYASAEWNTAF